jgi:hypothetical protein
MGNVYTQTNETENKVINFRQEADGRLTEVQRIATGGRGTGGYTPVTGEMSSPRLPGQLQLGHREPRQALPFRGERRRQQRLLLFDRRRRHAGDKRCAEHRK